MENNITVKKSSFMGLLIKVLYIFVPIVVFAVYLAVNSYVRNNGGYNDALTAALLAVLIFMLIWYVFVMKIVRSVMYNRFTSKLRKSGLNCAGALYESKNTGCIIVDSVKKQIGMMFYGNPSETYVLSADDIADIGSGAIDDHTIGFWFTVNGEFCEFPTYKNKNMNVSSASIGAASFGVAGAIIGAAADAAAHSAKASSAMNDYLSKYYDEAKRWETTLLNLKG